MEEQRYARIIYGLKLKMKILRDMLCEEKRIKMRNKLISIENDIQELIDDYER